MTCNKFLQNRPKNRNSTQTQSDRPTLWFFFVFILEAPCLPFLGFFKTLATRVVFLGAPHAEKRPKTRLKNKAKNGRKKKPSSTPLSFSFDMEFFPKKIVVFLSSPSEKRTKKSFLKKVNTYLI
jgi:hypothetical protein